MTTTFNLMSNKKKLAGIILVVAPITILVASLIYQFLNHQDNSLMALISSVVTILLFLLSLILGSLGIILIVSSRQENKFSIKEVVSFGYNKMKENFWFFAGILVIYLVISFLPTLLDKTKELPYYDNKSLGIVFIIVFIIIWIVQVVINIGLLKIGLLVVDGKEKKISDLYSNISLFINFLVASILYGLMILGGLILFIIPGIIWQVKFSLFPYFIIEGYGPIEALKKSGQVTNGSKANIFLLSLLFSVMNLAGTIFFLVGLLVTMPISIVGTAYVYRKLAGSNPKV